MTSEISDSDDNCDELSELRNRREFETQPSVDVSCDSPIIYYNNNASLGGLRLG